MKLDFNFEIKQLNGDPANDEHGKAITAGKILAQMLSSSNKGNAIKLTDWALKLWNGESIEVDQVDSEIISELVNQSEWLTNLSKAQILRALVKTT